MYCPAAFRETRPEILRLTISKHPQAVLVTVGIQGIDASHIPLLHRPTSGGYGVLRGHLARANPQWKEYVPGSDALAIFSGPQHYVSPTWYPSKQEHGKVVPTWNYVTVHARGKLTFTTHPEWLLDIVRTLTEAQEISREPEWRVSDAPRDYIENQLGGIIGVELAITGLEGKWKLSQNRSTAEHDGVIAGLEELDSENAGAVAKIMKGKVPA
jgi:transcriptional regulator